MKISFEIINTLIPQTCNFETESSVSIFKIFGDRKLRKNTRNLFNKLKREGHEVWIYTTSKRSIFELNRIFYLNGLKPHGYINERINKVKLEANNCKASINPNLFGIDIHIDNSLSIAKEGEIFEFNTVIVSANDENWHTKVLDEVEKKYLNLDWQFKQIIISLIALKSSDNRKSEIYGYGNSFSEAIEDFDTYYALKKDILTKHEYFDKEVINKLDDIMAVINDNSHPPNPEFHNGTSTHADWNKLKDLSLDVLKLMKKENVILEVKRTEKYNKNSELIVIKTKTKLVET